MSLFGEAIICLLCLVVLLGLTSVVNDHCEADSVFGHANKRLQVFNEYLQAYDLLEAWRVARPFLWVGQCPYARSLAHRLVVSYEWLMQDEPGFGSQEKLESYRRLLDELPPRFDPPNTKRPRLAGSLLFGPFAIY